MANNKGRSQNLIKPSEMNPEEAKEFHSKGGKASGKSKRRKKLLKETLEMIIQKDVPTEYMELRNFLSSLEIAESEQNMQLAMAVSLIQKAISGELLEIH